MAVTPIMSDSSTRPYDNDAFADGFAGEPRDRKDITADYVSGAFARWYLGQRDDAAEHVVDELAEKRLLKKIADNHAAKAFETAPSTRQKRPALAIAASVLVAALALTVLINPLDKTAPPAEVRGHAPEEGILGGSINDLEALRAAMAPFGDDAVIGETRNLDEILDPAAPEYARLKEAFEAGETIYFARVTVDDPEDLETLSRIAASDAFSELNAVVNGQRSRTIIVDGSAMVWVYLFKRER